MTPPASEAPEATNSQNDSVDIANSTLRHDLRNRVNQIVGYSEMLLEEASEASLDDAEHPFFSDLGRIREASRGLLTLIDEALPTTPTLPATPSTVVAMVPPAPVAVAEQEQGFSSATLPNESSIGGNLLVIDDSEANRALLARRLEMQGHRCTMAAGGSEGLALLMQKGFDVVLLDLMMPGMDGFEVLRRIKSNPAFGNPPVVMISASDEIDSVVRCIEMGAADYLTKPFNATLLRARIASCLREKRLRDREAQLFQELQANYERERKIADALQRSLIEDIPENSFPDLAVAALYEAAWSEAQVGGDLFDAFALPGGRVALAVADASGKGLAAATRVSQAKYVLRAFAREYYETPEQIVGHLNDFLCSASPAYEDAGLSFVVLSLAIVDPATGISHFVSAGCEPPLILRGGGDGATEAIVAHGLPLGIEPGTTYSTMTGTIASGDTIVMCTDGITEARRGGDLLGYERMAEIARVASRDQPRNLRGVGAAILEGARAFGQGTLRDDACLLLARRN